MSTYYFVAYENRLKKASPASIVFFSNVILKDVHPLVWLANPPASFAAHYVRYLHFWSEITEDVALAAHKYVKIAGLDHAPVDQGE